MYVPATLALPATPLSQPGALATQPPVGEAAARPVPLRTALHVRGADLDVLAGRSARITGTLVPRLADRGLAELRRHGGWRTVVGTHTGARGRYRLRLRLDTLGSTAARVLFRGDARERSSHRRLGPLNVFRLAGASWYGGGGTMACGGWLTSSTLGVAQQDAAVRDARDAALRRAHGARAGRRPRSLRGWPRIRSHRSDQARAGLRRGRGGVGDQVSAAGRVYVGRCAAALGRRCGVSFCGPRRARVRMRVRAARPSIESSAPTRR